MSGSRPAPFGPIDRVVFGDNQFFGINHMSQDKAQERAERFASLANVMAVYDHAVDAGIEAVMLNSNARAREICDAFRANPGRYGHLRWYPSIPYPHKYAAMVNDKGMVGAIQEILFDKGAKSALGKMVRGAGAVATLDAVKLMKMLIDEELAICFGSFAPARSHGFFGEGMKVNKRRDAFNLRAQLAAIAAFRCFRRLGQTHQLPNKIFAQRNIIEAPLGRLD